jgi:hypothetical protein
VIQREYKCKYCDLLLYHVGNKQIGVDGITRACVKLKKLKKEKGVLEQVL